MIDDTCPDSPRAAIFGLDHRSQTSSSVAGKVSLYFKQSSGTAARRSDARNYQSARQPRPDYLKLILLLAMIFLPWVAIGYIAWQLSSP